MNPEDLFQSFAREYEAAGGVLLAHTGNKNEIKEALKEMITQEGVSSYAISKGTPRMGLIDEILKEMGVEKSRDYSAVELGITGAQAAGASTGTLVFAFQRGKDHLLTSLPRIHMAVLREGNLYMHVSQAVIPLLKEEAPPSYISLVTGPSMTGDIELEHVKGVHGPERLYLMVVP